MEGWREWIQSTQLGSTSSGGDRRMVRAFTASLCFVFRCLERATLVLCFPYLDPASCRRMVELTESLQKLAIDGSGAGLNGTGAEELEELRAEINRLSDNIYGERVTTPLGVS